MQAVHPHMGNAMQAVMGLMSIHWMWQTGQQISVTGGVTATEVEEFLHFAGERSQYALSKILSHSLEAFAFVLGSLVEALIALIEAFGQAGCSVIAVLGFCVCMYCLMMLQTYCSRERARRASHRAEQAESDLRAIALERDAAEVTIVAKRGSPAWPVNRTGDFPSYSFATRDLVARHVSNMDGAEKSLQQLLSRTSSEWSDYISFRLPRSVGTGDYEVRMDKVEATGVRRAMERRATNPYLLPVHVYRVPADEAGADRPAHGV